MHRHHDHDHCPHCRASLPDRPSRLLGVLAITGAWTVAMAMVFGGILLGPAIIIVLLPLFFGGMSIITVAHEWAAGDRICPGCGRWVEVEVATASIPPLRAARAS